MYLATNPEADALLERDPLALLVGMVLDQQIPLEKAFTSPYVLTQRLGRPLDAAEIAAYDPDELAAIFTKPPALHRFPGSMAKRVQATCRMIADEYGNDTAAVWREAKAGDELLKRVKALPGFGEQKAKIFVALLGKQMKVRPRGWREAAGEFGEDGVHRSVADITDTDSLREVRAYKQEMKRKARES